MYFFTEYLNPFCPVYAMYSGINIVFIFFVVARTNDLTNDNLDFFVCHCLVCTCMLMMLYYCNMVR